MPLAPLMLEVGVERTLALPGEPIVCRLLLANPSPAAVATPLPADGWWHAARLVLRSAEGRTFAFSIAPGPAAVDGPRLTIDDDADRVHDFALTGRVPPLQPGAWRLDGVLDVAGEAWPIAAAEFVVERLRPPLIAPADTVADPASLWVMRRGDRSASLEWHEVSPGAGPTEDRFAHAPPQSVKRIAAPVEQLAGGSGAWPCTAWLQQGRLFVGCGRFPFHLGEVPLPGTPAALLPRITNGPAGGSVFVLAADRLTLWRIDVPWPQSWPDGEILETMAPLTLRGAALGAAIALPVAPSTLAADPGVALLSEQGDAVELRFCGQPPSPAARSWVVIGINGAKLLADAAPSVAREADGSVRVAVLFVDRVGPHLGLALLSFDAVGQPVLAEGSGRWRVRLPGEPLRGTCELRRAPGPDGSSWRINWAVRLADGGCWISHDGLPARPFVPQGEPIEPLCLLAQDGTAALACVTDEGRLQF